MVAGGVSTAITLPLVGWGVNGACLAIGIGLGTLTGLGFLIAVPVWFGTSPPAMSRAAPVHQNEKTQLEARQKSTITTPPAMTPIRLPLVLVHGSVAPQALCVL